LTASVATATLLVSSLARAQAQPAPAPQAQPPAAAPAPQPQAPAQPAPQPQAPAQPAPAPVLAPPGPPPGYVPLVIEGRPAGLRMELKMIELEGSPGYVDRSGGISCDGSCRLDVPPGRYRLRVIEPGGRRTERTIRIREPEKLIVGPVNDSTRTTGLVMGIIGSVMVPVGIYMMINGASQSAYNSLDGEPNDNDGPQIVLYGLMVFITGAALAPVGWVMFGRSGRFTLDRESLYDQDASVSRFTLGIGPLRGGGQLGAAFTF
jgi:hypothetical protein